MSKLLTQVTYGWYAEMKGEAKAVAKQTMALNTQLNSIFQTQFANQQSSLSQLSTTLNNMINNPQGYSPAGLAAMQTQAIQGNAAQFAGAQQNLNSQLSALTGGGAIGSGAAAMLQGQLDTSEAANQSNALLGIQANNAQLQVQNRNQALGMLPGVIQQQGQLPSSIGALQNQSELAFNQAQQAFKSPWASILGGIASTALGAVTGGIGGLFTGAGFGSGAGNFLQTGGAFGRAGSQLGGQQQGPQMINFNTPQQSPYMNASLAGLPIGGYGAANTMLGGGGQQPIAGQFGGG